MSTHAQRVAEARELGGLAGKEYQYVANMTCPPEECTKTAQAQWCETLDRIAENPYMGEGEGSYALEFTRAFNNGRHAEQADQNRKATVQ